MAPPVKRKLEAQRRSKYASFPKRKVPRVETPRVFAEPQAEGRVPDDGLSTTQLCRALDWFLREDWTRRRWWETRRDLREAAGDGDALGGDGDAKEFAAKEFATQAEAHAELRRRARNLLLRQQLHLGKQENKSSDLLWARKMVKEGTLRDRFTALELLTENCPVVRSADLRRLFASTAKHNRTEKLAAFNHCRNLLCSKFLLPNDSALQRLEEQAFGVFILKKGHHRAPKFVVQTPTKDDLHLRLLFCMVFEDQLREIVEEFVKQLETLSRDTIAACRKVCIQICRDMLLTKPEQEDAVLQVLVKLLGDLEPKVSSMASYNLAKILKVHPGMKINVAYKIEQLVWSQRISLMAVELRDAKPATFKEVRTKRKLKEESAVKAQLGTLSTRRAHQMVYNGALFLSELQYSPKLDPPNLASEMLKRFWRMLKIMLQPIDQLRKKQRHMKDKLLKSCTKKKSRKAAAEPSVAGKLEPKTETAKSEAKEEETAAVVKQEGGEETGPVEAPKKQTTVNYLFGLAHTTEGNSILRHVLGGIRRLIPFVDKSLLDAQMSGQPNIPSTVVDELGAPAVASSSDTIVSQLFNLCHNVSSWATRVYGWDLLYTLMKQSRGVTSTYLSNLASQLRDIRFVESRARKLMIRLVLKIAADAETVDLTSRVALLRRLLSIIVLSDDQPDLARSVFDMLLKLFEEDPEILNWWKMECEEETATMRFDPSAYNVSQSRAENSPPWESALLATCLGFEELSDDEPLGLDNLGEDSSSTAGEDESSTVGEDESSTAGEDESSC
eukprot:Gregarina_sp_Pseudo_9__1020@NODE_165_length_3881_cov_45_211869_g152_i0_p1_GENE_NODE_165_length_3881_cov_45_211869_g152_i0NODE_165_length_3881_cov_45_211869_g152_i0_p1_ORF_typecomplete_len785_score267_72CBF/PF03914_17/26CBF/PF03914_17/2_5e09Adaptin_N/PF01602_20/6_2e06Adaptin_N/PF01602_20/1_4e02Cnd1/PF12717_7/1_7e05Cnd1/PF12717_7/1e03Vac14_Fab1_bd/PF12755_7/67Vac14_Fab1_bd/PF12755_7/14Vac14_Fab1_bd/PF12755_7/5_8Vac14_Fab1_bd/PF12755_7/3_7e03Proteasom_PSMB/PF10508_9/0_23Proteasom_PSMB/PF10508_9/30B